MIVMMIIMFMPVIGLPVFWLIPLRDAAIIYVGGFILSALMMWVMHRTKKTPVKTGYESLLGRETTVVSMISDKRTPYQIRVEGEIWFAGSQDSLKVGDPVTITAVAGNKLQVKSALGGNI